MPSRNIQLIRARRRYLESLAENGEQYQPRIFSFPAMIGKGDGTVYTSRTGWIYVTDFNGVAHEAINVRVPNTAGRVVIVGNDQYNPQVLQVLSLWHGYNTQPTVEIPFHNHRWDGEFTNYFEGEQFLPGLLVPIAGGMTADLYPIYIRLLDGGRVYIPLQTLDFTSHRPSTGARWATVGASQEGAVTIADGGIVDTPEAMLDSDIPAPVNPDDRELWAVKLWSGQTEIRHRFNDRNLVDLRWGGSGNAGGAGPSIGSAPADTPLDADKFGFWDVVDVALKSITWANLKAALKSYFDTVYAAISHTHDLPPGTHIHDVFQWVSAGGTTFDFPDFVERVEVVSLDGYVENVLNYDLSSDSSQLVFSTAITSGTVIQANYIPMQV